MTSPLPPPRSPRCVADIYCNQVRDPRPEIRIPKGGVLTRPVSCRLWGYWTQQFSRDSLQRSAAPLQPGTGSVRLPCRRQRRPRAACRTAQKLQRTGRFELLR